MQNTYLHGAKELNNNNQMPQYDMEQWIAHTNNLCDPFIRRKILRQIMSIVGICTLSIDHWD